MKRICILANKYPTSIDSNACVFIQQLVWQFSDYGNECIVINPMPITKGKKYFSYPYYEEEKSENGAIIKVYHPKYLSFGQDKSFFQKTRVKLTTFNYYRSVLKVLKHHNIKPDIIYSHFLCPSGVAAAKLGKKINVPSFLAHGEAIYKGDEKYGNKYLKKIMNPLTGVIAVSSQNKDYCVNAGWIDSRKVAIFPNGYRKERFYKISKKEARAHFGLPEDKFIVGMCGSFDDRKGVLRLQSAVDQIDDVYFICAGKGKNTPNSEKCLLSKPINNNELRYFYNCLDIFVLPTLNEGCCNAIVEAIACGCPIISSDKSFNYDICDSSNSILIDPMNIDEIKNAILKIKGDKYLLEELSYGSLKISQKLLINDRANNILKFMLKEE